MSHALPLLFLMNMSLTTGGWSPETYEVLFTNPVCPRQKFVSYRPRNPPPETFESSEGPVEIAPERKNVPEISVDADGIPTLGGGRRQSIPGNIFCRNRDFASSTVPGDENPYRRTDSPLQRVQEWIEGTSAGDELFLASYSFSQKSVANWACAASQRGVKVKVFMQEPEHGGAAFDTLRRCQDVEFVRFNSDSRLAHFKTIVIVDKETQKVRISFQSGNITTGTWGHHENWNFITLDRNHWFSQDHICLRDAISETTVDDLSLLYHELDACRSRHGVDEARARDPMMQSYFIPKSGGVYDDRKELDKLVGAVDRAAEVWIAAHHMSEPGLAEALIRRLKSDPNFRVKMLVDSEVFWAGYRDPVVQKLSWKVDGRVFTESDSLTSYCLWGLPEAKAKKARCSLFNRDAYAGEYGPLALKEAGAELRFIESNHLGNMLFHNKFIIFRDPVGADGIEGSVFTGAGNLTKAGFERNFENFYWVRIPHVYKAFREQFSMLFEKAVEEKDLPLTWDYRTEDDGYEAYPGAMNP